MALPGGSSHPSFTVFRTCIGPSERHCEPGPGHDRAWDAASTDPPDLLVFGDELPGFVEAPRRVSSSVSAGDLFRCGSPRLLGSKGPGSVVAQGFTPVRALLFWAGNTRNVADDDYRRR